MRKPKNRPERVVAGPTICYVLKGFPRLSEMFIASEIARLEQLGLCLRLVVLKPADEEAHHQVVDRIRAQRDYLPAVTSLSATPLARWLRDNFGAFLPALSRVARRRPAGLVRAAAAAFAQAVRARRSFWSWPRKIYLKEFLQAAAGADLLLDAPDVRHLHAHFCHGATTVAWLTATMTGLPFSFTAHAKDIYCASLNPAGLLARKLDAARFVVTCTEANRAHLQPMTGTRVHRVYHGLNADFSRLVERAAAPSPRPSGGPLRALAVGRLVPKKGFDVFVEACGILHGRGVAFDAEIVGEDGEHEREIRRRITALGLEGHVRIAGPMPQSRLFEAYRGATAFCLPCRILDDGDRDGLPNVIVEAMACGLPVVTTGISGIPEVVRDGINGLLVPPDDAEALAAALVRLDGNTDLARRLARAGQATVRAHFDGAKVARELAALFEEALG
jgi:glycosyltransferase involved in cell wall biosynthesis